MNIRKPVSNPFGEPPQRPNMPNREKVNEEPQSQESVSSAPLPQFPTSGVMKPSTPGGLLPPLPNRPQTSGPFTPLPPQPAVSIVEPELEVTFEENIENQEVKPLSEEEELHLHKLYLSIDDTSVPQTLYALATDEDWQVRNAVASNLNTPESILLALSRDDSDMVRQSVMENPAISEALLASFASDEDIDVLIEFIEFERTTVDMLEPLFQHEEDEIIDFLQKSDKLNSAEKFKLRKI